MKKLNQGPKPFNKRLIPFVSVVVAAFFVVAITLINYQIVDADEYQKLAEKSSQTTETVAAARGQITDRYGRVLVTSRLSLSLQFGSDFPQPSTGDSKDESAAKNKQGNDVILRLTDLFTQKGMDWVDQFPITETEPYSFLPQEGGSEDLVARLKTKLGVQSYATADNCMQNLMDTYDIIGYTPEQTRQIAGVRGQMLMRDYSRTVPYTFAQNMDSAFAGEIMEMKQYFPGVMIAETSIREYPSGDIAPQILGTTGPLFAEDLEKEEYKDYPQNAIIGKSGIEKAFEQQLRGKDGKQTVVRDGEGKIVDQYFAQGDEPRPGNTVVLSIDSKLQKELQEALRSYVVSNPGPVRSARGAGLSVIDVKTGETLALVSYPGYDINTYNADYSQLSADPLKPLTNRALQGLYRPGSSFKTFMATAAQLNGTINDKTYYTCANPFPGTQMSCVQMHHSGPTNVYTALQYSCNNFFYYTAKNMGIDAIDQYAPYFGFATDSGLEITNSDGRVTSPDYYQQRGQTYLPGYTYQTGIGQAEVYVTPLQMSISMMTIANRGTRYAAHVVKSIEKYDYSENVSKTQPEVLSQLPSDSSAYDVTLQGMKLMAQTRPALGGLDIATKSGSPQYNDINTNLTNAAGVGIYPASSPEIGIGLLIEDGKNAQDFFRKVVEIYEACKGQEIEQPISNGQLIVH